MKKVRIAALTLSGLAIAFVCCRLVLLSCFPRPYLKAVERSGVAQSLVYAVIRAESGYREDAVSRVGAVGLMQVRPSTAEFICGREGIMFENDRLLEGDYNIAIGTRYLLYLFARFENEDTALAAYNAGEGTVRTWLEDERFSSDGISLKVIPYEETAGYVKKIRKFKKIYEILY